MRECLTHKFHDFQYSGTWIGADTQTFHNDFSRAERFPVFPVFNIFVINHWSADTVSRVSCPRCGSGNLGAALSRSALQTLHNAQIWNTRTLTFNRENMLYIFPSRECLMLVKCITQSPKLIWISKNIVSRLPAHLMLSNREFVWLISYLRLCLKLGTKALGKIYLVT